jgi:hypothetical protein
VRNSTRNANITRLRSFMAYLLGEPIWLPTTSLRGPHV